METGALGECFHVSRPSLRVAEIRWTPRAVATKSPFLMTRTAVALCALGLAGAAFGATPAADFTARGKELMANKEARSDAERFQRLLEISWE